MSQQGSNLRASHFVLGNTNQQSQFVSTMKMNFKQGSGQETVAQRSSTQNARASHFELGAIKSKYQTSFGAQYRPHLEFVSAKLDDEKKHDLRTNHFQLGHQDGNKLSVTKATFTEKPITNLVHHEQEIQKAKMRAHHHQFAETEAKAMRTYYNEQYQGYGNVQQTKPQEGSTGFRQSNIVLGKEHQNLHSVQQQDYNQKERVAQFVKVVSGKSHFDLGIQQNDFKTTNQEFKASNYTLLPEIAYNPNLRASHFKLGQDSQPYVSIATSSFQRKVIK